MTIILTIIFLASLITLFIGIMKKRKLLIGVSTFSILGVIILFFLIARATNTM